MIVIYIYTHIHVYTYIYIYIERERDTYVCARMHACIRFTNKEVTYGLFKEGQT